MNRKILKFKQLVHSMVSQKKLTGSAIMLVMFILSAVMIIIFAGSSVVISGLKMGRVQSDSIHAYFAAESGIEKLLYKFRKEEDFLAQIGGEEGAGTNEILTYTEQSSPYYSPWSYVVNYVSYEPMVFTSIGSYGRTRRSVEVNFY